MTDKEDDVTDNIPVRVRDCACPATPHKDEGDIVYLRPVLSLDGGLRAEQDHADAVREAITSLKLPDGKLTDADADRLAERWEGIVKRKWLVTFLEEGAVDWNLWNEDGPIPFDLATVMADYGMARAVAQEALDRFSPEVMRPLARTLGLISAATQTNGSTSRTRSTRSPRRSSSRNGSAGRR